MKNVLFNVTADLLNPYFFQLGERLKVYGYFPQYVTFTHREYFLLKKNKMKLAIDDINLIHIKPINTNLFTNEELTTMISFNIEKYGGETEIWKNRILRIGSFLDNLLTNEKFELIIIWNSDDLHGKILKIIARNKNIKGIFIENGYFPKTLQIDKVGVNINNSVTKMTFSEIKEALNSTVENKEQGVSDKHSLKEYKNLNLFELIYCFLIRKSDPFYYIKFPERRGNSWFSEQLLKLRRIQTKEDTIILPEKFIFIPFQVHDDTQILLNSKNFKSMETFFEFAYSLIKKNFGNEFKVIVKEHPEDLCRYSYKNLYKKYPDVIWLKKFNVDELLDKASYVFVINSSVGLQAIQKFKPTLVCGDSFYSRDEIAFCIKDMNDVDSVVNELKNNLSEDKKKNIEIFMKFLKEKYFVSASWKHITSDGIQKSTLKILEQ